MNVKQLSRAILAAGTMLTGFPALAQQPGTNFFSYPPAAAFDGTEIMGPIRQGATNRSATLSAILNSGVGGVNIKSMGAKCDGATDDTVALNATLAANRVVLISAGTGTCMVSGPINIVLDNSILAGSGFNSVTFKSTVAATPVIKVAAGLTKVTLHGFSVDRSIPATAGGNGIDYTAGGIDAIVNNILSQNQWYGFALGPIAYGLRSENFALNNYSDGFHYTNLVGNATSQWTGTHNLSQANDGWGYNYVATVGAGGGLIPLMQLNDTSFGNTLGGVAYHGSPGGPIYDVVVMGGVYGSDGGPELYFDTYGGQHRVGGGALIELAGQAPTGRNLLTAPKFVGRGIDITGANNDVTIGQVLVSSNSQDGLASGAQRTVVSGAATFADNGQASIGTYSGMYFNNNAINATVVVTGARSGNANNPNNAQGTGIGLLSGVNASIIGNDLTRNAVAGLAVGTNATSLTAYGNLGAVTSTSGVGNIPVGATSVVITHGMSFTPTQTVVTPTTFQGSGNIWVDTITATTFTVHLSVSYTSLVGFSWLAKIFNT